MSGLSISQENYLKTIYLLSSARQTARVTDIAARMGLTKASVSLAVSRLEGLGLVVKTEGREVALTDRGRELAYEVQRRYATIWRFLRDVVGLDEQAAADQACKLEHLLTSDTLNALARELLARAG